MTARFQNIDDTNRGDHYHLSPDDECYFIYEYTSGHNYEFSQTNSLISNLKKKPSLRNTNQYKYKGQAIRTSSAALAGAINSKWLPGATLIPVPPSKAKNDPEYDDRILQVCKGIPGANDIRELVVQTKSLAAAHESTSRPSVDDLLAVYAIDKAVANPAPTRIGIVDDVLTAGTHFTAMKTILKKQFPDASIVGFFIARRVLPNPFAEFEDTPI